MTAWVAAGAGVVLALLMLVAAYGLAVALTAFADWIDAAHTRDTVGINHDE